MANADGRSVSNSSSVIALAESLREAQAPARIPHPPAELALGLLVRRTPPLGHHGDRRLAGHQPPQPARDMPRRLGAQRARQHRQPLPQGRGLVVDDVVDARPAVLDGGRGRRRGVDDMDVREDAAAVADDGEATLAERPRPGRRPGDGPSPRYAVGWSWSPRTTARDAARHGGSPARTTP